LAYEERASVLWRHTCAGDRIRMRHIAVRFDPQLETGATYQNVRDNMVFIFRNERDMSLFIRLVIRGLEWSLVNVFRSQQPGSF
jgi:hypothetical protein